MTEFQVNRSLTPMGAAVGAAIRAHLHSLGILTINVIGSPGSGKTSLLEHTLPRLANRVGVAVITGDIETSTDADRLAPLGIPVLQVNTGSLGGACHLPPELVASAIESLDLESVDLLFIENVGNLVCPAEFDIGEDHKVPLLSLTEGEDKPLKYPLAFREATLVLVTKTDLLPYLSVDKQLLLANLRRVNPRAKVLFVSTLTGEGLEDWIAWLEEEISAVRGTIP